MATMEQVTRFIQIFGTALYWFRENHARWILPSVGIAQLACETGWNADAERNNYGGIKATENWKNAGGETYWSWTKEDYGNGLEPVYAEFRAYASIDDFLTDYFALLLNSERYSGAVNNVNYRDTITELKNGGYATDKNYISILCDIIEDFNLTVWDKQETIEIEVQPIIEETAPQGTQNITCKGVQVKPIVLVDYDGTPFTSYAPDGVFDVLEDSYSDRLLIGFGGELTCAINLNNVEFVGYGETDAELPFALVEGSKVRATECINYDTGEYFKNYAPDGIFDVLEVKGDRVVIGFGGQTTSSINICFLELA